METRKASAFVSRKGLAKLVFEFAQANITNCTGCLPGRYTKWLGQVHLGPDVDFSAGRFYVYKLFIVEPGFNPVGRHAQANTIQFVVLK